ncbi:HNH endonuclease [Sanguibacter inulinus]|uniref:HNH endonuclease n=1 Tax=Sanguibacter inulinus TaxID=60922 RepID=A0A853EXS5_9MICO|nr:HNH endonuclease signature motif containing protein [Sanguibacter inulinus]MBF0724045.1 HNH endonuclease [Sanguibacter inulinus]NYS95190.1 HNH endonuclease [Sanguibacter inulinus]
MARLSDLTESTAVEGAISEFRRLGRHAFLSQYGFRESTDYFILDDGDMIDSKPVAAAALARQHPNAAQPGPKYFERGTSRTVRALEALGFTVVTRAQLHPPLPGAQYRSRTEVQAAFGGDNVAGPIRFPGEDVVNLFSDENGPYTDDPPSLSETFGYRGQGSSGPQRVDFGANPLIEDARESGSPVRFWHRPKGGVFTFECWVVVESRAWVMGIGKDKKQRVEINWRLRPVPGPNPAEWPEAARLAHSVTPLTREEVAGAAEVTPAPTYDDLVRRVEELQQTAEPHAVSRTAYQRQYAARRAVLIRSDGQCESKRCTGMPPEPNRRGQPILDVDHIVELSQGGEDHPLNMVALCPNCHAAKTRGKHAKRWEKELSRIAAAAHDQSRFAAIEGSGA